MASPLLKIGTIGVVGLIGLMIAVPTWLTSVPLAALVILAIGVTLR